MVAIRHFVNSLFEFMSQSCLGFSYELKRLTAEKFRSGIDFRRILAFTSAEVRLEETGSQFSLFSNLTVIMKP